MRHPHGGSDSIAVQQDTPGCNFFSIFHFPQLTLSLDERSRKTPSNSRRKLRILTPEVPGIETWGLLAAGEGFLFSGRSLNWTFEAESGFLVAWAARNGLAARQELRPGTSHPCRPPAHPSRPPSSRHGSWTGLGVWPSVLQMVKLLLYGFGR